MKLDLLYSMLYSRLARNDMTHLPCIVYLRPILHAAHSSIDRQTLSCALHPAELATLIFNHGTGAALRPPLTCSTGRAGARPSCVTLMRTCRRPLHAAHPTRGQHARADAAFNELWMPAGMPPSYDWDLHPKFTRRQREYDSQRATPSPRSASRSSTNSPHGAGGAKMPSSKGEPTDPELREKIKEEVKNEEKGASWTFRPEDLSMVRSADAVEFA